MADISGIAKAFLTNQRKLKSFFQRRFGPHPDVDDLTQEVFLRATKAAEKQTINDPDAYLFGVARYVALGEMSKRSHSIVEYIEEIAPSANMISEPDPDRAIEARESWRRFSDAVAQLPRQCRQVFILKKVYGYSNKEVSAALGISTSTVEKHVALGMRRTFQALHEEERQSNAPSPLVSMARKDDAP